MNNYVVTSTQKNGSTLCICEVSENCCGAHGAFKNGATCGGSIKLNKIYEKLFFTDYDCSDGAEIKNRSVIFHNASIHSMKCDSEYRNKKPFSGKVIIYLTAEEVEENTI